MDIGDYIKFRPKGADDGLPPKVPVYRMYNRPIRVLKWEVKKSRFDDGSWTFAEVTAETLDGQKETVRFNTGSQVIVSQLNEISKAMNEKGVENDRTFTCVIRSFKNFIKMYPMEDENKKQEENKQ